MARKRSMILPGTHQYYVTEYAVYPSQENREPTDTMLIQFFVLMYFTLTKDTGIDAEKQEFFSIYDAAMNPRQKGTWIDGRYGPNTRRGILLFERCIIAPYKDGIVRPICDPHKVFQQSLGPGQGTKLEHMNWYFNEGTESSITRQMSIFRVHSSDLYSRFF